MVGATEVIRELGIPRSTLYRLVKEQRIPVHEERKPWQKSPRVRFLISEVRTALDMPTAPPPAGQE